MDVDWQQNKRPKGDEEVETEDNVTRSLDKRKCVMQITQGENEFEEPTLTIEHLPSTLLSAGVIKKKVVEGDTTKNKPSLFSYYLDIKRHDREMKREI